MADHSEDAMLEAVRDRIRAGITVSGTTLDNGQIEIEYDEEPPASVQDVYIMIIPAGATKGPAQTTIKGTAYDKLWSVKVVVVLKADRPRDRMRDLYALVNSSLNQWIGAIEDLIHGDYTTMNAANTILTTKEPGIDGFHEPLEFERYEGPTGVDPSYFDQTNFGRMASKGAVAGIKKAIVFGGMRRTKKTV